MSLPATTLTADKLSPCVREMQFAVRGPIVIKAMEIEKQLKKGEKKPFEKVLRTNIGDCHATGQQPVTFLRDVIACCMQPKLLETGNYPEDVKSHVHEILASCDGGSMGAYTESAGLANIRRHIAQYIEQRDGGIPSNPDDIFLANGASDAIKSILRLLMTGGNGKERGGVLIAVPRYPLYTATMTEMGGVAVGYYLDEENNWALSIAELDRAIKEARQICVPRAIVIINPGNPTGAVLTEENIREIIKFAHREKLVILADEVYQSNIYGKNSKFHSFKKVLRQLENSGEITKGLELASFLSASKGFYGECGLRGGYCEIVNFHPDVVAQLLKTLSVCLCGNTAGQAATDVVVNPPKPGDPSYPLFAKERDAILAELKEKSALLTETFNSMPGLKCNPVDGAMYAFVKLELSPKAIEAAKQRNQQPDEFYCFELLEQTGICVVPGGGFGQKPGTYHFRTTILPPVERMREAFQQRFRQFHLAFLAKYK